MIMCNKSKYLICFLLLLGLVSSASAAIVANWPFDEGAGTTAVDTIGGQNATLGGSFAWAPGKYGSALSCDGGAYADVPIEAWNNNITTEVTVTYWFYKNNADQSTVSFQALDANGG